MPGLGSVVWLFALATLALALRGQVCVVLHPPTLLGLLAWTGLLGLATEALARTTGFPGWSALHQLRATWVLPLAHMAVSAGVLAAALTAATRLGPPDAATRWTGLPVTWVGGLVLIGFGLVPVAGAMLWARLASRYLQARRAEPGPVPRDPWLPGVAVAMGLALVGLVWTLARAPAGRFAHLRAWLEQKVSDPREAGRTLARARAAAPDDPLADSLLYRLARIYDADLSEPEHALPLFQELVARHPDSPWADDAELAIAAILARTDHPEAAITRLAGFATRYPGSALVGEAGWLACTQLDRVAPGPEAVRCLEGLLDSRAVVIRPERYPFQIVRVGTLAREALAARPGAPPSGAAGRAR